jgi:hypothetical protein
VQIRPPRIQSIPVFSSHFPVPNRVLFLGDMAAATGYSDAPTDEQLLAYAELPKHGRDMAEVFAVRIPATVGGNLPPRGSIVFYGGHCCSDFIYSWSPLEEEEDTSKQICDSQVQFPLISPS